MNRARSIQRKCGRRRGVRCCRMLSWCRNIRISASSRGRGLKRSHSMRTNKRPTANIRRSCSDSSVTASQMDRVFRSDSAPHIHGELLKLDFAVAQSTVAKYMAKRGEPPGQSWGTFLRNHMPQIAAMDLFVVPTIGFIQLYVLVIVRLARRELAWINVTAHPTAEWIAQQIVEAFPWNEAPRYLIRDRDAIYGAAVTRRIRAMGIRDKPIAPGSPWQNCFAERLIGSIRRECVDHVIALGEQHLRQVLKSYANYYNTARTHRSLDKDAPVSRSVQRVGPIVSHALVGGLHHQYVRI